MLRFLTALLVLSVPAISAEVVKPISGPVLPKNHLRIPIIRQATNYSCGAAAMLSILTYWNLSDSNESSLYADLGTSEENGTHPEKMVDLGRQAGLNAHMSKFTKISELRSALRMGFTVILDFQAWREDTDVDWKDRWEDGHYSILMAMDDENIYLMDPSTAAGYTYIPISEFEDRWHDYEIEDGVRVEYKRLALFFSGKSSLKSYPNGLIRLE